MPASRLLDPAVPHAEVLEVARRGWQRVERAHYTVCLALRRLFRDYVHRGAGYARFDDWAEDMLGIPAKLAWTFSLLGRDLERLPRTREALERGEITYTKAREFARIATAETEEIWVSYARTHTNREIERRVRRAEMASDEGTVRVVTSRLGVREAQATRAAGERLARALDRPVSEGEVLPALATLFVEGASGGCAPDRPTRPYLALHLCPQCLDTWAPLPGENVDVPVDDWLGELRAGADVTALLDDQLCGCTATRHRRDVCPVESGGPTGGPPESRHVPGAVRAVVEARDGFRCRVPGCRSSGPLEFSHLRPFAEGGPTTPRNVVQHCATHNALIASGRISVEGSAPFERYFLADGTFLGVGYDPVPRRGPVPHVGNRSRRAPVPAPEAKPPSRATLAAVGASVGLAQGLDPG